KWVSNYTISETTPKTIAIIMAGNIPLVGFHDFLSILLTGNKVLAKLSSNDKQLLPFLAQYLISIEPEFKNLIEFTEGRLTNFDAVIATGSDNTARYFEYYFSKYPNIIRKNRNSVAVLTGDETKEEMELLANDVFRYFGLGCRNVSKIFFPEKYDFDKFFNGMFSWKHVINNHKYINNYDYNKAVYLMSNIKLLDNEYLLLKEDTGYSSPISVTFYETYANLQDVKKKLKEEADKIQAIVSNIGIDNEIPFGTAQNPELWDYADGVDTVDFLLKLS
ncbi:MAG TPA: acyl-CoA reductase, partial [Flavobacteriaceae bacterium]|nr:acyl-CoA reductase [Flavobacteriaceae bacterium]